jgi:restriction system protein
MSEPVSTVPTYEQLMHPLLKIAADRHPHRVRDVADRIAETFGLPENLRQETLPDGRNRLVHRLEWARTYLKKAGLLEYPSRGQFLITDRGLTALKENPSGFGNKYLQRFDEFLEFKHAKRERQGDTVAVETEELDPEEAIEDSYQTLRAEIEHDLLSRTKSASPEFFEQLVIDLLLKMGYGGSRKEAGHRAVCWGPSG